MKFKSVNISDPIYLWRDFSILYKLLVVKENKI